MVNKLDLSNENVQDPAILTTSLLLLQVLSRSIKVFLETCRCNGVLLIEEPQKFWFGATLPSQTRAKITVRELALAPDSLSQ